MKNDLNTKQDIKLMVDSFYNKVNHDDLLSEIFNDFAQVDWDTHLPIMYNFWGKILLGDGDYNGNPFGKHIPLPVEKKHFDRWVFLFEENMRENFEGEKADSTILRAKSIAHIFQSKLKFIKQ